MHLFPILWFSLALSSWKDFESVLPAAQPPVYNAIPSNTQGKLVMFRDKEGLSPYCQQVWLALELKGIEYITVMSDGDDALIKWPDGEVHSDSLEALERIQSEYPDRDPDLFKRISKAVDNVRCNIQRFKGVFPRNTDPSLYAPYIFRKGELVSTSSHMVSLEETDEVMEEYDDGPFLCGDFVSAADIVWAPFLERYAAQLPLTHDGEALEPRYGGEYEALEEWFEAMESIPCYACAVAGDRVSWENVLKDAVQDQRVPAVNLLPPRGDRVPTNRKGYDALTIWKEYAENKPYLCSTPEKECAAYLIRNRHSIANDASEKLSRDAEEIDSALLEVVGTLIGRTDESRLSGNARDVAAFVDDQLRVPRDMGMIPAAALRALVSVAPKPRIKG